MTARHLTPPEGIKGPARALPDSCTTCQVSDLACVAAIFVRGAPCCRGCTHNEGNTTMGKRKTTEYAYAPEVRAWLQKNGHQPGSRGRFSATQVEAFESATGKRYVYA